MSVSPKTQYLQALNQGFVEDQAQLQGVDELERCFQALEAGEECLGVYLWGPVGRGKTWLMDSFYQALSVPKRRQHFHHFLAWLHKKLFSLSGQENPLQLVAQELASEIKVLCFDELFVSDIGDAMLLGPLFQTLFNAGVVLVVTSNQAPQDLYDNGFNRERFFPAIDALIAYTHVVHLDGDQDHRLHAGVEVQRYFITDEHSSSQFSALFTQLSGKPASAQTIILNGRELSVHGAHAPVLWVDFAHLCEGNLAAQDYMQLATDYQHILLSAIPSLSAVQKDGQIARGTEDAAIRVKAGDRELPKLARHDDAVRRFIALVDECYEQGVLLYIQAAEPLAQLYTQGSLTFAFARTQSRIAAMQTKAWPQQ